MSYDLLGDITARLTILCPPVEAFAIGGSELRDQHSDLDFFLLLPSATFFESLSFLQEALIPAEVAVKLPWPEPVRGFGYRIAYVMKSGKSVEFFANCEHTLSPNSMRSRTKILHDPSGTFSALLKRASFKENGSTCPSIEETLCFDLVDEFFKTRKCLSRRQLLPTFEHLFRLLRLLACVERVVLGLQPLGSHDSLRDLSHEVEVRLISIMESIGGNLSVQALQYALKQVSDRLEILSGSFEPLRQISDFIRGE
jgi:hypothetical protein